jgi:hypothetical protein
MKILEIIDNDDGSCTMDCEFSQEELNMLLSYAVVDILKKQIKVYDQEANLDE